MERFYFDYASTTPVDPLVIEAMTPYFFEQFGNPSSPHAFGRTAGKALEDARETLAKFLGVKNEEIVFTSGATEANNYAIFGTARGLRDKGNHIVVSAIEHSSVLRPVQELEKEGFKVTYLSVDSYGRVDPGEVRRAVTDRTILIAVMHASNEIGTIQPVGEIGAMARERGIRFLVDAVQTVGHVPLSVQDLSCDLLSLSAHKFYGPKGVGALYVRQGTKMAKYLVGGDQERGRRASTQNVAGAVGLARAITLCRERMAAEIKQQTAFRDVIIAGVTGNIAGARLNGHPTDRLPNNAHFAFEGLDGEALLMTLDMAGVCASMGSACTSGALEPSHVLRAIGLDDALALGALRISIGRWTTQAHIDHLLEQLSHAVRQLRT